MHELDNAIASDLFAVRDSPSRMIASILVGMNRWLWSLCIVAACAGKRETNGAELAGVKSQLAAYEACLTGNQPGDFTSALALTLSHTGNQRLACVDETRGLLVSRLRALAKRLDAEQPELEVAPTLRSVGDIGTACRDLAALGKTVDQIAKQIDGSSSGVPTCELGKLSVPFVQPPEALSHAPELRVEDGALIAYVTEEYRSLPDSLPTLGRSTGDAWDVRKAPKNLHEWTWPASGPVGITWQEHGLRTLMVDDGHGGWRTGARTPIDGVGGIWKQGDRITISGFEKGHDDVTVVRRSVDGGTTIGPAVPLGIDPSLLVKVRVRGDGSVIALGGSTKSAVLEAARLAPDATKAVKTARLTWNEPADVTTNQIWLCGANDVYWAIHRRHLVMSSDAGQSWHEVGDLGAELDFPRLACNPTLLAVWSKAGKDRRELRVCSAKGCAKPIGVPFGDDAAVGFDLDPTPQIYLATGLLGAPFAVEVSRIEPDRPVRTRVLLATPARNERVGAIRDGAKLVLLHGSRAGDSY
jgi:hypothetical protein